MSWIKKLIFLSITWFILLIASFLLMELILLSISNNPWHETTKINLIRDKEITYQIKNIYESDRDFIRYKRNIFGLRDNCKHPSDIDILTIGGSTTDQRYIEFENTYQYILQEQLKEKINTSICVSNAGIDGHSTFGHIYSFQKWFPLIPNFQPKIFIFYIGLNDANFLTQEQNSSDEINNKTVKGFLKKFMVFQSLIRARDLLKEIFFIKSDAYAGHIQRSYLPEDYTVSQVNPASEMLSDIHSKKFRVRLKRLIEFSSSYNAKHICVTQPHKYIRSVEGKQYGIPNVFGDEYSGLDYDLSLQKINKIITEECEQDTTIDLYNAEIPNNFFYDGIHMTPRGNQYIGSYIAREFIDKDFQSFLD